MDGAAAHAHRVDDRDAAGGDVVAVAHAAAVAPPDVVAEIGAAAADQLEQLFRFGVDRLRWAAPAAVDVDPHVTAGCGLGYHRLQSRLSAPLVLGCARPYVHAQ